MKCLFPPPLVLAIALATRCGEAAPATRTFQELKPGVEFYPGDRLACPGNPEVQAGLTKNGVLEVWNRDKRLWATPPSKASYPYGRFYLVMRTNGQLVVNGQILLKTDWNETWGDTETIWRSTDIKAPLVAGATAVLDAKGNLVFLERGKEIWRTPEPSR